MLIRGPLACIPSDLVICLLAVYNYIREHLVDETSNILRIHFQCLIVFFSLDIKFLSVTLSLIQIVIIRVISPTPLVMF